MHHMCLTVTHDFEHVNYRHETAMQLDKKLASKCYDKAFHFQSSTVGGFAKNEAASCKNYSLGCCCSVVGYNYADLELPFSFKARRKNTKTARGDFG